MRILELGLLAFGPFADVHLDFSRSGALHVIYGPNEAGKSTALRAITSVLYGIPVNTQDAHRHAMPDLRIAARLAGVNGARLDLVRRKGAKNTLLDAEGNTLPDDALAPLLAGVNEAVFRSMFGLDHATLREGAEALLQGKGAVGESLFAAAIGGPGLHALREQLERETTELYKPRGQNPHLNEAIKAFAAAEKRSRESARSADAYRVQQDALVAARQENAALADRRRALGAELSRLQRALRVLPLLTRRQQLHAGREALGNVPRLPTDAALQRTQAQAERAEAVRERARLASDVETLVARRGELRTPESVLAIGSAVIEALQNTVGSVRAAASDLPRRRGELVGLEEQVLGILVELGRPASFDQVDGLRVSPALQARIRALAHERSGIFADREHAVRACDERSEQLAAQRRQLAALPEVPDLRALQQALQRAQRLGEIDDRIDVATGAVRALDAELCVRLAALNLWKGDERGLRGAPLPAAAIIEEYRARFDQLSAARSDVMMRAREAERRRTELTRDVDELRLTGGVPTEAELEEERRARDALWWQLREQWNRRGAEVATLTGQFEQALRSVDQLADRLRREASRVATLARLTADLTACASEREAVQREEVALRANESQLRDEWATVWAAVDIHPLDPSAMSGWLARAAELLDIAERRDREAAALAQMIERRTRQRTQLSEAAATLGASLDTGDHTLGAMVERVDDTLHRLGDAKTRRTMLLESIAATDADRGVLERRADECRQRWDTWQREWESRVAPLGLGASASPAEALAVLDQLVRLFARVDEIAKLRQRIGAMEQDAGRLGDAVATLARLYAPELAPLPPSECADQLVRSYRKAEDEQRERLRLDADVRSKAELVRVCDEQMRDAETRLAALMARAAVSSVAELEPMEQAAAAAARCDRELREVDDQLLAAGEGAATSELIEQTRELDPDAVRARIAEVETEMEDIAESQRELHQRIGSLEAGMQHQENAEGAADAATEAQEHLAAIKSYVRKYLRLRLASIVIRREIERYRERNQGPLIARASALFPRLTLGHYTGLRVGFDAGDEPVLRCVNDAGGEVGVQDLSDGTRDQLYLALRVATLEHHAQTNPLMPVVLDDVLVHFDDARTRAALTVLGELAAHTQVLLFTHHARVVELARAALPEEKRVEHVLGDGPCPSADVKR